MAKFTALRSFKHPDTGKSYEKGKPVPVALVDECNLECQGVVKADAPAKPKTTNRE